MTEIITTAEELDALQDGTILADSDKNPVWRDSIFGWCTKNGTREVDSDLIISDGAPLAVLYCPDQLVPSLPPTCQPSREQIEEAIRCEADACGVYLSRDFVGCLALSVLALTQGRSEAEVKAEALREGAARIRAARRNDDAWHRTCDDYREAGWDGDPDGYERMFWEAGHTSALRSLAGGEQSTPGVFEAMGLPTVEVPSVGGEQPGPDGNMADAILAIDRLSGGEGRG